MNDSASKLTPELVLMAINGGLLDPALDNIKEAIRIRREVIAKNKAGSMIPGDRFFIKDCSPKKWNGIEVTYKSRDGMWLVCDITHPGDARSLNRYGLPGDVPQAFREIKLRETHVGTFTRHQMTAG
jgi:hypothetical protein